MNSCKHVLIVKERHLGGLPKVKQCRVCNETFHIPSSKELAVSTICESCEREFNYLLRFGLCDVCRRAAQKSLRSG